MMFMSINSETLNCKHARMKKAVRSQREQKDVNCGSSVIHFVAHVPTSPSLVQAGNKESIIVASISRTLLVRHTHTPFIDQHAVTREDSAWTYMLFVDSAMPLELRSTLGRNI